MHVQVHSYIQYVDIRSYNYNSVQIQMHNYT